MPDPKSHGHNNVSVTVLEIPVLDKLVDAYFAQQQQQIDASTLRVKRVRSKLAARLQGLDQMLNQMLKEIE